MVKLDPRRNVGRFVPAVGKGDHLRRARAGAEARRGARRDQLTRRIEARAHAADR